MKLKRLNLHLRTDHINRLSTLACALGEKRQRDTRLAEALELALVAGLSRSDDELLKRSFEGISQDNWLALGPVVQGR